MPDQPKPAAVVFAKDIRRVARFYEEVLAMAVTHADRDHIVLDSEQIQLVIHGLPAHIADGMVISRPPEVREDTPLKLCLPVSSIAEARIKAVPLGGELKPPAAEWQVRGFRACDGHDPEGNVVQFREGAAGTGSVPVA